MKSRSVTLNLEHASISELNKSLSFYYGEDAFLSPDGKTLHFNISIDDQVLEQLAMMTKSEPGESKILDSCNEQYQKCCDLHDFNDSDYFLENRTLLLNKKTVLVINRIKQLYVDMAHAFFGAEHLAVPNTIDVRHLQTADYFKKFPAQAMLVSTLPLNPSAVYAIAKSDHSNLHDLSKHYEETRYALNPVTCYHLYSNFNKLYEKSKKLNYSLEGKAHRYEGKHIQGTRLIEFNMAEIVFMETNSIKVSIDSLIDFYKNFFELLQLPIKFVVSSDAFFTIDADLHSQLQERTASKIEIVFMEKQNSIVVGSINTHFDFFVKRFHLNKHAPVITTKCTGIGIDRLALALYSYYPNDILSILENALARVQENPVAEFT